MNQAIPFALFASCLPVKGAKRSSICDLQRQRIHFIPNILYAIITGYSGTTIEYVKSIYGQENSIAIDSYFEFLQQEELIFFTLAPESFPLLSLEWKTPSAITNGIWDIDENVGHVIPKVVSSLNKIGCKNIQLRNFSMFSIKKIEYLLSFFENTRIENIEILIQYQSECLLGNIQDMLQKFHRISSIFIYSAPQTELIYEAPFHDGNIYYIAENISSSLFCGKVFPKDFSINIPTFTESHHHNSCLNRKISIDVEGNIKNCPSMSQSFGNIKDTTLQEALDHPDFKKYWNVTKDQIAVCKDCEFRYICTDCRGYIENPEDMYSKPLKCGYNPYTCEWEEWSTNPLKQKAIDYYGMREVLPEFKMKPDYAPATSPGTA